MNEKNFEKLLIILFELFEIFVKFLFSNIFTLLVVDLLIIFDKVIVSLIADSLI